MRRPGGVGFAEVSSENGDMARGTRRPIDRTTLLISAGLAFGLVLIIAGLVSATTGREALGLPDQIERIAPGEGDSVLRQSEILVDLIPGQMGELVIDGQTLPVTEIVAAANPEPGQTVANDDLVTRFDLGTNTLRFLPQEGAPIERLDPGPHTVKVVYWPIDVGRSAARSFTWQFDVSI